VNVLQLPPKREVVSAPRKQLLLPLDSLLKKKKLRLRKKHKLRQLRKLRVNLMK
jgi:hypothetical protein